MTPERWRRVESLLEAALERTPEARAEFLDAECAADPSLRREVESLLAAHAQAESFIEEPAVEAATQLLTRAGADALARRPIGPYRLIREIGHGGMGIVYLAERADAAYQRRVAIKLVRRGMDSDMILRRFRSERQILASLDHANIARLFDGGTTEDGRPYFVMEYIEGQPIDQFCNSHRLSTVERLKLLNPVCAAVHYAHQNLVVHRDIKPNNILVTAAGVPKLLDFGIAKLLNPGLSPAASPTTAAAQRLMTPEYASPEQVRGEPVTPASDVYSLGVVLYELLTGQWPYRAESREPLEIARVICEQEPERPSTAISRNESLVRSPLSVAYEGEQRTTGDGPRTRDKLRKQLQGDLDNIVLMSLRKEPQRRYASVEQLSQDIERYLGDRPVIARRETLGYRAGKFIRRRATEVVAVGALIVLTLVAAALGYYLYSLRQSAQRSSSQTGKSPVGMMTPRRAVAVLGFKNLSGRPESAWLSTAFSEMLGSELAAGGKLRMVPGENVTRMKIDLALPEAESFTPDTLNRIRANLGTDLVILGSYAALGKESGGQLRLDLRLQDAISGDIIAAVGETGAEAKLFDLVAQAGTRLRERLGVAGLSEAEAATLRASQTSNQKAERLYIEGLQKLRRYDALAARELLEQAVAADPNYPLAHTALASAWASLGYDLKARESAKKAFDLSAQLSREEHLSIEARYRETIREWGKAIEIHRTLFTFFPDNLEYGLRLAGAQNSAGQNKESLATHQALRQLPPPSPDDPRIDVGEAATAESLGDHKMQLAAATRAVEKGQKQGAKFIVGRALNLKAWALHNLGEEDQAIATANEARQIFATVGDRRGMSTALNNIGVVRQQRSEFEEAKRAYNESLALRREIGWQIGISTTLNNLAIVFNLEGRLGEALKMYQESLTIAREISNRDAIALAQHNIGIILKLQGKFAEAKKSFEEGLVIGRELDSKVRIAYALLGLEQLASLQGNLAEARRLGEESLAICRQSGYKSLTAQLLSDLGSVMLTQGDLTGARQHHEEALSIRNQLGHKGVATETRLHLADLSIEEGRPAEAEAPAREAIEYFRSQKLSDEEGLGLTVLARSLLVQGKTSEAQQAIVRAVDLVQKSEGRSAQLWIAIIHARVRSASGRNGEAVRGLELTLAEVRKSGLVRLQFEARLALGEIELNSDRQSAGRARLVALETEAKTTGFGLIARKAAVALGNRS